jgi:predicted Fe-Mo cluster-binding NifX family protein
MILFITSQDKSLQSQPNMQFGRAPFFIKYNMEKDAWEALENPAQSEPGGAGIAASQFVINNQASAVISGRFGPNAHNALKAAGIDLWTFDQNCETVAEVIELFKSGLLSRG